jgi:hypothetical protein
LKQLSTLSLAAALSLCGMTTAQAADLLNVDLTVPNQITITALPGLSAVTASGSTTTGFYFQNFFSGTAIVSGTALVGTANLTAASVASDGSPALFRATSGTDPGLNVWSYSATSPTTFTAGAVAFTGSATWSIPAAVYSAALAGSLGGNVYFPADDVSDLASAVILGSYTVTAVPEPATVAMMGLGALGLLVVRRRKQDCA